MNILKVEHLYKSFKELKAVEDLSLCVEEKDIMGLLGPNGAGKSTTINCILGLLSLDEGSVIFEEKYPMRKWKKNIGYVPQELAIYEDLTAKENVRFFCSLYGFKGKELENKTNAALEFVGLKEVENKKAITFSGGMKRRLNIACGIAHNPKLIIMDEPTVGIDPQSRNYILNNIKKLNEMGSTIIYTTHYMPEVEELCNKITVIDKGKVITTGTKKEIIEQLGKDIKMKITFKNNFSDSVIEEIEKIPTIDKVTKISDNELQIKHKEDALVLDELMKIISNNNLTITNINQEEPSLEELFLDLTGEDLRDKA